MSPRWDKPSGSVRRQEIRPTSNTEIGGELDLPHPATAKSAEMGVRSPWTESSLRHHSQTSAKELALSSVSASSDQIIDRAILSSPRMR